MKLPRHRTPLPRRIDAVAGFILLEVLVATTILTIGLFALIDELSQCVAAARRVQNYSVAENLLANKCYEFHTDRATDYLDQESPFEDLPGWSWERKFESTDAEGLWQQTITVYWYERGKLFSDSAVEYRYLPQKPR
jgi:type II secretion system protein I